jgi:uncharacterized membrane protein YccC
VVRSSTAAVKLRGLFFVDDRKLLFSLSSFVAAALVLVIAFTASLPRPWWALLTVYVTAQPMAGSFRPKTVYRLAGIIIGAAISILLAPNLQNSPILLVLCLALWIGFCIYLAVLDRTPRAFLFQMAAFSSAVLSFPYLDDPSDIFTTTVSRVEEMALGIVCVTIAHMIFQPTNVRRLIHERTRSFLEDACRWTAEALATQHMDLKYEHRRKLAADVTELGMMAVNLPFDQRHAFDTRATVTELQHRLAMLLSLATAVADRLDLLRSLGTIDGEIRALVESFTGNLNNPQGSVSSQANDLALRCRSLAARHLANNQWSSLVAANLLDRMAEFVDTLHAARVLVRAFGENELAAHVQDFISDDANRFPLARDHRMALLAGAATAIALVIYCAVWIGLDWPNGSTTAAFSAIVTLSFAAQDDPAPAIGRYLTATLMTFPLAALYLFVILPRVDGVAMLLLTIAPAFIWLGYIQADPARTALAMPMFSCFIVALAFIDRFEPDFAGFVNTGLAQLAGIVTTLLVTRIFRSVGASWSTHRVVRQNWADIVRLSDPTEPIEPRAWTARSVDRLGQIAARMALAPDNAVPGAAHALRDIRVGRNIIHIREGLASTCEPTRQEVQSALLEVSRLYQTGANEQRPVRGTVAPLAALDRAITILKNKSRQSDNATLLALIGLRCNLFPDAQPVGGLPR